MIKSLTHGFTKYSSFRHILRSRLRGVLFGSHHSLRHEMAVSLDSQQTPDWLHQVLKDNSSERYQIEYQGFLANHIAQAIISLYRSGCDEDRIRKYTKWYAARLEPTVTSDKPDKPPDVESLLGQHDREHFNHVVNHYKQMLDDLGNMKLLLRKAFPKLSAAVSNSALHCLIELGYGVSVGSSRIVCQGLAYLHFSYAPFGGVEVYEGRDIWTLGKGTKDVITVLKEVRNNHKLRESVLTDSLDTTRYERTGARFQNRLSAFLDYHTDTALDYVHSIKFPEFWDPQSVDVKLLTQIGDWVTDCAITAYVASERKNDFFLLHGVTGSWSLGQILPLLNEPLHILRVLRVFLCTIIGAYIGIECPDLNSTEEPTKTITETFAEAITEDRDEHVYKLIQVCAERDLVNPESRKLYTAACNIAIKYPLSFVRRDT